jgi:uncharacterized protein YcbK (DUF882 family)
MSNKIDDLDPQMQVKVRTFLSLIPIPYVVTSTLRTIAEQQALHAQGRKALVEVNALRTIAGMRLIGEKENGYTVTNCDGVLKRSNHQSGKAIDVVPAGMGGRPTWPPGSDPRWEMIGKAAEEAGLSWGGRWASPDYPHSEEKG